MRISDWSSDVCSSDLDVTSLSIKTLLLVAIIGSLICGKPYFLSKNINLFEYYSIVLLSVFSLLFLTSSTDLISIYLCLEMQSLCFYVLASFNRSSVFSTDAGLKYFLLGAFFSCLFLLVSSVYRRFGKEFVMSFI